MDDLISRSAVIDALMKQPKLTRSVVRRVLAQMPVADAEGKVRCGDCKYQTLRTPLNIRYCTVWDRFNGMGDDGYCSYGERREEKCG